MANPILIQRLNEDPDPTRCTAFVRVCKECGTRFKPDDVVCSNCGVERPRCTRKVIEGETVCPAHKRGRPYSLYTRLAGSLSDSVLEEFLEAESDSRDLSQEYALAKIAISSAITPENRPSSKQLLVMLKDFFSIAEKKHNIEKGLVLNLSWNDELVNALRKRVRKLIFTMKEIIEEFEPDKEKQKVMIKTLLDRTRLIGSLVTVPHDPTDYVEGPMPDHFVEHMRDIEAVIGQSLKVVTDKDV